MSTGELAIPDVPSERPARRRHLAGGALASAGSQVAILVAIALASIAIARLIGPAGNGAFALVATLYTALLLVVSLGLRHGLIYEVSRGTWSPREAAQRSRIAAAGLGLPGTALGIGLYALTSETVLSGLSWPIALMAAGSIPFGLMWIFGSAIALARERYEVQAALLGVPHALVLFVGVPLAIPFGITGAIAGFAGGQVVAGLAATIVAGRDRSDALPDLGRHGGRFGEALRFGIKTWVPEILQSLSFRIDIFFLNAYVATSEVGVFSVAATVTAIAWILPKAFANVVMPRAARNDASASGGDLSAAESDESVARPVRHAVLLTPVIGLGIALLLVVAVPLLYGSAFEESVELGLILLPGVLAMGIARILMSGTMGRGRPEYALYNTLLTVPVMVALYLLLIPEYGATGAAVGSSIGYLLIGLVAAYYFRRATGIGLRQAYVPSRRDVADYRVLLPMLARYARDVRRILARRLTRSGPKRG